MLDIKFLRENPELVKENIKKKFQDSKLPLVDEVIALDEELRANKKKADDLRANRNKVSKSIWLFCLGFSPCRGVTQLLKLEHLILFRELLIF